MNTVFLLLFWIMTQTLPAGDPALRSLSPPVGSETVTVLKDTTLHSVPLNRSIRLDVYLPPHYDPAHGPYPVLYMNDGQDGKRLRLRERLDTLFQQRSVRDFVVVAIYAGDRIQEYGVAAEADYLKRGSKAGAYTDFLLTELLPHVQKQYHVSTDPADNVVAGFSLGGLQAFDVAFHHPERFSKVGVFSGSFWWRSKSTEAGYRDETDRIMHDYVRRGTYQPTLNFWLQTGTLDETEDRNGNGVIDAIDDTLDIIQELEKKGYRQPDNIRYVEVEGGHHNPDTWGQIMPDFLRWAFGK